MAKKKQNKTIIQGINPFQRALLEINPSTDRYVYIMSAKDMFDLELGELPISKLDYLALYEKWSENDKNQLNTITSLLNKDVSFNFKGGEDADGEFGQFSVENSTEMYVIKIYGSVKLLSFFQVQYLNSALCKPGFTIDSLYQEALKQY